MSEPEVLEAVADPTALVPTFRVSPAAAQELRAREAADLARIQPMLDAIAEGKSLSEAAAAMGITRSGVVQFLRSKPVLLAELRSHREALRELAQTLALGVVNQRLDNPARISNRDLTDILRATKPYDNEQAARVTIKVDL